MNKKNSGNKQRNISLPTIQRKGKNLAKIVDTERLSVAYCWFQKNISESIPGITDTSNVFTIDVCTGRNKRVSVYLSTDQMHDVIEECRRITSLSLCDLAQRVVLDSIKRTDSRYIYWSLALREFHLQSISDSVDHSSLEGYIPWMVGQILSCSGIGFDDDNLEWLETILAQYIEAVYHAELAIKCGERYIPAAYLNYDSDERILEPGTNIHRWPTHTIRIGYKPFVDGVRNDTPWQFLAQTRYIRYTDDPITDDDGELICMEANYLDDASDPAIRVAVSSEKMTDLLSQIEYCLREAGE